MSTCNRLLAQLRWVTIHTEFKMAQENVLDSFSGQRANKEFWAHDKLETERKILKMEAHKKSS